MLLYVILSHIIIHCFADQGEIVYKKGISNTPQLYRWYLDSVSNNLQEIEGQLPKEVDADIGKNERTSDQIAHNLCVLLGWI